MLNSRVRVLMGIWYPAGDGYGKIFVPEVGVRGWGRVCAHWYGSGELIPGGEFLIDISNPTPIVAKPSR
jgi:hypothetical protein